MKYLIQLLLAFYLVNFAYCFYKTKLAQKIFKEKLPHFQSKNALEYSIHYFEQKIDHLEFNSQSTFQQKYLVRDKFYQKGGPILFYCGNEGPIEMFYENSGFLHDTLAKEFNALIVYMEHRYYGDSMPYGTEEESYKNKNIKQFTSLQALYDYNIFLSWFKEFEVGDRNTPTFAFGGSYGGMLAVWLRMKFPNVIDGAVGSSAPIIYFKNRENFNFGSFFQVATDNYNHGECKDIIKESFRRLQLLQESSSDADMKMLSSIFNLCDPITKQDEIPALIEWVGQAYIYMAMLNYPYPADFLKDMPAWPANYSCTALENTNINSSNEILFSSIKSSVDTFYDYKGTDKCNQIFDSHYISDADIYGWFIQACAEMVTYLDSPIENNMFPPQQFNTTAYTEMCYSQREQYPQYDWILDFYGGKTDEEFASYSNILFMNGALDPWAGGTVYYTNEKNDFGNIFMYESAHHLDLRLPNERDPIYVKQGRSEEIKIIRRWIQKKQQQNMENEEILY